MSKVQKLMIAVLFLVSSAVFAANLPATKTKLPPGVSVTTTAPTCDVSDPIPCKQITIINNSDLPIYPYIEIGQRIVDQWLQGYEQVNRITNPNDVFPSDRVYRIYIGANKNNPPGDPGMAAHTMATIDVPFYSKLVGSPKRDIKNQYIDWWNGGRVSINDNGTAILSDLQGDSVNPVNPTSAGPACAPAPGVVPVGLTYACSVSRIFFAPEPTGPGSGASFQPTSPEQLTEYTFAGIDPTTNPYGFSTQDVDYDISYVDHVYLPVAMEPINNPVIGYVGSVMTVPDFRTVIDKFVGTVAPFGQGWPVYKKAPYNYTTIKIPATYNVTKLDTINILDTNGVGRKLIDNWFACAHGAGGNAALCESVDDLFKKNYANFQTICADNEPPVSDSDDYAQHVYGFVAFDNCKGTNPRHIDNNGLAFTPGANFVKAELDYKALQYSAVQLNGVFFNPFVNFIHSADYLHIKGSYAFSIDDIVGNMLEKGDGIVIAVGGKTGLPNPNEYDPTKIARVILGSPTGSVNWSAYQVCGSPFYTALPPNSNVFSIQTDVVNLDPPNGCVINVKDTNNSVYTFNLLKPAPFADNPVTTDYIKCSSDPGSAFWCGQGRVHPSVTGSGDEKKSFINTPPPISGNDITVTMGSDPVVKWKSYGVCKNSVDQNIAVGSDSFIVKDGDKLPLPCTITVSDSNGTLYNFNLIKSPPFAPNPITSQYIGCSGALNAPWCAGIGVAIQGAAPLQVNNVNAPKPVAGNNIVAPFITSAARAVAKSNIEVKYNLATGGTGQGFTYTYIVNGTTFGGTVTGSDGDVTLLGVGLSEADIVVQAQDKGNASQIKVSNLVTVPADSGTNPIVAPNITSYSRVPGNLENINVQYTVATGGTGQGFTYTYIVNGSPWAGSVTGPVGNVVLVGVGLNQATIVVQAHDNGDFLTQDSDQVTVPAAGGTITPPQIPGDGAYWLPPDYQVVLLTFNPATGGSGGFKYTYQVDGKEWPNVSEGKNFQTLLKGLNNTVGHTVTITATDSSGNSATSNPVNVAPH